MKISQKSVKQPQQHGRILFLLALGLMVIVVMINTINTTNLLYRRSTSTSSDPHSRAAVLDHLLASGDSQNLRISLTNDTEQELSKAERQSGMTTVQTCACGILNKDSHKLEVNTDCPASAKLLDLSQPPAARITTKKITFFLIYFNDHHLLAHQLKTWTKFSKEILQQIQFLIVDDGSKNGQRAQDLLHKNADIAKSIDLAVYRVDQNLDWNIGGARNLGFLVADTPWVFMSDGDTLLKPDTMEYIISLTVNDFSSDGKSNIYGLFQRMVGGIKDEKPHPAVMLSRKTDYWMAGGCDEDFVGEYGQTDPHFRHRVSIHPSLNLIRAYDEMDAKNITPMVQLLDDEASKVCPDGIECLEKYKGSKLKKDPEVNKKLLELKKKTNQWSNEYLRFTWKRVY